MIIRQTTTIVFEYPQDYLQEQEWCKTKDDRWVHKSTDTLCSVYENQISYCIGQPKDTPDFCPNCGADMRERKDFQVIVNGNCTKCGKPLSGNRIFICEECEEQSKESE